MTFSGFQIVFFFHIQTNKQSNKNIFFIILIHCFFGAVTDLSLVALYKQEPASKLRKLML